MYCVFCSVAFFSCAAVLVVQFRVMTCWNSSIGHQELPGHDCVSQHLAVSSCCCPWRCDLTVVFGRRT